MVRPVKPRISTAALMSPTRVLGFSDAELGEIPHKLSFDVFYTVDPSRRGPKASTSFHSHFPSQRRGEDE